MFYQAIAYVIGACADQSEAINTALPHSDQNNQSYHIEEILPGGEKELGERKCREGLANGSCAAMSHLIGSKIYDIVDRVVWKGSTGSVFGHVVCSDTLPIILFINLSSLQSF